MPKEERDWSVPGDIMVVLELFRQDLKSIRFPDVDIEVLEEQVRDVESQAAEVSKAQSDLEEAQNKLAETQQTLRKTAGRGVSYARIFAEGNDELSKKVHALPISVSSTIRKKKPRRRTKNTLQSNKAETSQKDDMDSREVELPFIEASPHGPIEGHSVH